MNNIWENFVSINSDKDSKFSVLGPASEYLDSDTWKAGWESLDYGDALAADKIPLPLEEDREGYYIGHHFSYWASGFYDYNQLLAVAKNYDVEVDSFLDLGCASGRVTRHFGLLSPEIRTFGCDINRLHVEWCNRFLPRSVLTFQNHSIPTLPLPDSSVSMISAFSVFTHIEAFETTWLMELRRILKPGGLLWLTVQTDLTLGEIKEESPLFKPVFNHPHADELINKNREFSGDRLVLRRNECRSYSSVLFYKKEYVENNWSRFFELLEFRHNGHVFQDVLILRK